jgi:hypothetical protein
VSDGWHYAQGQNSVGPLDLSKMQEVFSKASNPRDILVWKVGFKEWKRAEDVPELAGIIYKPPPLPDQFISPETTATVAKRDWKWTLLQGTLQALIVTGVVVSDAWWQWAPNKTVAGLLGLGAGWILTVALPRKLGRQFATRGIVLPIIAVGFALLTYKFATLGANDGTEGLTAGTRSAFVDTAIDTCVKQSDKNFSAETIAQYCRCYANGMADRVSINELKYIHNMKQEQAQAALQPKIDAADNACRDRLTP